MSCNEFEDRILKYQDGALSADERSAVVAHLAVCAQCRDFAHQAQRLDAALVKHIKTPALSLNFRANLQRRLSADGGVLTEAQRLQRKIELQSEFEAMSAKPRLNSLGLLDLMDRFGLIMMLSLLTGLALANLDQILSALGTAADQTRLVQTGLVSLSATILFLGIGLATAYRTRLQRLWMDV